MRKRKSNSQRPTSTRPAILSVVAAAFVISSMAGCSKLKIPSFQDYGSTGFEAIEQPDSFVQKQRSVEQILAEQAAVTAAAERRNREAASAAQVVAANGTETEATADELQQQDVVAFADARADTDATRQPANIAQTSFESEVDPQIEGANATEAKPLRSKFAGTDPPSNSDVKLFAQVDDFGDVPENLARLVGSGSATNLLRPSNDAILDDEAESPSSELASSASSQFPEMQRFGEPTASTGPLRPMLFNPSTRQANSSYQGTLRPLNVSAQEVESDAALESKQPTDEVVTIAKSMPVPPSSVLPSSATLPARRNDFQLSPSSRGTTLEPLPSNVFRPLSPSPSSAERFTELRPPTFPTSPVEPATTADSDVAQVIEVDREAIAEGVADTDDSVSNELDFSTPRVDSSLAQATARYLQANPNANPNPDQDPNPDQNVAEPVDAEVSVSGQALIPAAVFADAEVMVADVEREMLAATESNSFVADSGSFIPAPFILQPGQANTIPDATESNNDFKIQAVSSSSLVSVCRSCEAESCTGCELKQGEPLMANNDFAAPAVPDVAWKTVDGENQFIPPVSIPPSFAPTAIRSEDLAVNEKFGLPVALQQPPESAGAKHRVATLPLVGIDSATVARPSSVPPVGVAALMELNAVTWKSRLDQAIELAQGKLESNQLPAAGAMVNLRLLKAVRAQMMHVENKQLSVEESRFWEHQLEAITTMLRASKDGSEYGSAASDSDIHRHLSAHKTLEHLRDAVEQLESIANLKISGGQFCTDISGYGQFRTFPSTEFEPAQRMLIYCEVENYLSLPQESATGESFRTKLRGSFAIYDADGNAVQQAEFPAVEDVARKKRRDFYMYLPVTLGDLPAGEYVMHLLVEDIHGNKSASLEPPLKFSVTQ